MAVIPTGDEVRQVCEQAGVQSPGVYRTIETHLTLAFTEPNAFRMDYEWRGVIETLSDTRFFERRSGWSGKGMEGPPKVTARIEGRDLRPRRHGTMYRSGEAEKYLIDFGEDIPAGKRVQIQTESRYVDEASKFKPFLSAIGRPSFQSLSLTVKSVMEMEVCEYIYSSEDDEELICEPISAVEIDHMHVYSKLISPVDMGRHKLIWTWK